MDSDSSHTIEVTVDAEDWRSAVTDPEGLCRRVVASVLVREAPERNETEVSVLLTDDERVQELNRSYRGKDRPTNVLSFPAGPTPDGGPVLLGDIAVAFETTRREAEIERKPLEDHLCHLLVHGTLHLLGYDHEAEDEAEMMEAREVEHLAALGVADPYRETAP